MASKATVSNKKIVISYKPSNSNKTSTNAGFGYSQCPYCHKSFKTK